MTASSFHSQESSPNTDLLNELNTLLQDYTHIHDAPKQFLDTLTDIKYLSSTLNSLSTILGSERQTKTLHLPSPVTSEFAEIILGLKADLRRLDELLKTWPDPPTFSAKVSFSALHKREVKVLREKIIRSQLSFTVLLGEFLLPEDDSAEVPSISLSPDVHSNGIDVNVSRNGDAGLPLGDEIAQEENSAVETGLVDLLLTLPPTMRLSRLVQKLEEIQKENTISSEFPKFKAFSEDEGSLLGLAREMDERLL